MAQDGGRIVLRVDGQRFQVAADVVRHLAVLVALLEHAVQLAVVAHLDGRGAAARLAQPRLIALVVDAREYQYVQDQEAAADGDGDAERGAVRGEAVVAAAPAAARQLVRLVVVDAVRRAARRRRLVVVRRQVEQREHLRRVDAVVGAVRLARRRIQRLHRRVRRRPVDVAVDELVVRIGDVVGARSVQIRHQVQPERQSMGAIVVLQLWLRVCERKEQGAKARGTFNFARDKPPEPMLT